MEAPDWEALGWEALDSEAPGWEAGEALVDSESSTEHQGVTEEAAAAGEAAREMAAAVDWDWAEAAEAAGSERAAGSSAQTARGLVPSRGSATRHSQTPERIPDQSSRGWTLTQSCTPDRRCTSRSSLCTRTDQLRRRMFRTWGP